MPTAEELNLLYTKAWMDPIERRAETGGTDLRLANVYALKLVKALGLPDFTGQRILDFGAGRGEMLRALRDLGADVAAIEPFGKGYLESMGFRVYRDIQEIPRSERFDGVVMIDVFEHLTRPWDIIRNIYSLLSRRGWVYIATANPIGLNAKVFRGRWREANKAGHLFFPEPRHLERVFTDVGFTRWRRLTWMVRYGSNPVKIVLHYALQLSKLEGELRYIAWK